MVAVILMLYKIIHNIIIILGLGEDHPLIDDEVDDKEDMDRAEDDLQKEEASPGEQEKNLHN